MKPFLLENIMAKDHDFTEGYNDGIIGLPPDAGFSGPESRQKYTDGYIAGSHDRYIAFVDYCNTPDKELLKSRLAKI